MQKSGAMAGEGNLELGIAPSLPVSFVPMNLRTFFLALLFLAVSVASGEAGLKVIKARYGRDTAYADVRGSIEAYIRHNKLSFLVTNESMGADPTPGEEKYLYIVYEVDGREYKDTVTEGKVFTFRGIHGVTAERPMLGFIPPSAPRTASVRISNQTRSTVLVYSLDRYGRWSWEGELPGGRELSTTAAVGQRWRVTSRNNEELESFTVRTSGNRFEIGPPPPAMSYRGELYVYKLDRYNAWEWVARLATGASYTAPGRVGENWVVTDVNGRTVRQFVVTPGMSTVRCGP
jgi:hypothetical protein